MTRNPIHPPLLTALLRGVFCVMLVGLAWGCESDRSVNVGEGTFRLSHASNNIADQGAWSLDETNVDERWDQDPTIMEPDYPFAGPQPGFGSSAVTSDGS